MIHISPKWPILAVVAGAITYGGNYYQLAGLEHLRLEARKPSALPTQDGGQSWISDDNLDGGQPDLSLTQVAAHALPAWHVQLSVAEKLALWEQGRESATLIPVAESGLAPSTQAAATLPSSTPIPIPPGFGPSNILLHSSSFVEPTPMRPFQVNGSADIDDAAALGNLPLAADLAGRSEFLPPSDEIARMGPVDLSPTGARNLQTVRVATFNACSLRSRKFEQPPIGETLVRILRRFDLVAIQEIQSSRDDLLPMIIRKLNESGRHYDYLIGPRVGRVAPLQQFAIVFDTERLETDRYQLYTVDDPEDLLNFEPLVAWFRCKGVPQDKAFTFTLINLQIDSNFYETEIQLLPKLIDGIQNDGRNEDDWILVGDFAGPVPILPGLDDERTVRRALSEGASTVDGGRILDNLLFSARSTVEFAGNTGVFDFLRSYNLSLENALEISDRVPVWAEFSVIEGLNPGLSVPLGPTAEL